MLQRPPYRGERVLELLAERGPLPLKTIQGTLNHPLSGQTRKVPKAMEATWWLQSQGAVAKEGPAFVITIAGRQLLAEMQAAPNEQSPAARRYEQHLASAEAQRAALEQPAAAPPPCPEPPSDKEPEMQEDHDLKQVPNEWVTTAEAIKILGGSPQMLGRYARDGHLGRRESDDRDHTKFWRRSDLERIAAEGAPKTPAPAKPTAKAASIRPRTPEARHQEPAPRPARTNPAPDAGGAAPGAGAPASSRAVLASQVRELVRMGRSGTLPPVAIFAALEALVEAQ